MTIMIYFRSDKKWYQIVQPTSKFNGDVKGLVEHITKSNKDTKNYHSYEIL